MRASEIQAELKSMGISTADVFEKDELVRRLCDARKESPPATNGEPLSSSSSSTEASPTASDEPPKAGLLEKIRKMRARELQERLSELGISTKGVFEKEELVQRLYQAWKDSPRKPGTRTPLFFLSYGSNRMIKGEDNVSFLVDDAISKFPAIQLDVLDNNGFSLNLLLDTCCSALVLNPSIVQKHSLRLISTPVTMVGASGKEDRPSLTQLDRFKVGGTLFGPLPAAVQDITTLPTALDGIIGLSFLSQFACVELDFRGGFVEFHKKDTRPPIPSEKLTVVAEAKMIRTKLGVYGVEVSIDGRGPITLLLDTGASNSVLSWRGVEALGLSRNSPLVTPIDNVGVMGSDNIAMEMTHQLVASQNVRVGRSADYPGLDLSKAGPFAFGIGNVQLLEGQLRDECAGILGLDFFARCGAARFSFQGNVERFVLLN